MKKIAFISVVVCLFLIQGCYGSINSKWINTQCIPIIPTSGGYVKNYTLGERKTAFIGQEIIKVEICDGIQKNVIFGRDNIIDDKYNMKQFSLNHNTISPIFCTVEYDGKTFNVTRDSDINMPWGLLISHDGNINQNGIYSHRFEQIYSLDSIVINPDKVVYSNSCIRKTPTAISFELIFAGKNDVSLNTTYKEYSYNDLARPAFFQNLTYQANAKQIRFKEFLIQIHDVTNEQIIYTVLEDGLK